MATFANIGTAERRKRRLMGIAALTLGALVVFAAWTLDLGVAVRAASGFLFFLGFTGIFQARASTCVALASRGVRHMDERPEAIESDAEVAALRAQARSVLVRSAIAALTRKAITGEMCGASKAGGGSPSVGSGSMRVEAGVPNGNSPLNRYE